jgi:hypothetical protein
MQRIPLQISSCFRWTIIIKQTDQKKWTLIIKQTDQKQWTIIIKQTIKQKEEENREWLGKGDKEQG